MSNHEQTKKKIASTTRHYIHVVAFVVFSVSLGAFLMLEAYPYLLIRVVEHEAPLPVIEPPVVVEDAVQSLPRAFPTRLSIPSLNIDTTFEDPLALNKDGTIMVPNSFDQVGWYKFGASPGEVGTAAILGHVDSYQGAAVFYSLGQLKPGDRIYVTRDDGTEALFVVEYLERYKQSEFPTEKVYSKTEYPSLRLITCSGIYEKGIARYTHNLVVYARFVPSDEREMPQNAEPEP
jgi:sortase (surface protein transpeptidase)